MKVNVFVQVFIIEHFLLRTISDFLPSLCYCHFQNIQSSGVVIKGEKSALPPQKF